MSIEHIQDMSCFLQCFITFFFPKVQTESWSVSGPEGPQLAKGQIISKPICDVVKFSEKATKRNFVLTSKMGQIKKINAIFYTK